MNERREHLLGCYRFVEKDTEVQRVENETNSNGVLAAALTKRKGDTVFGKREKKIIKKGHCPIQSWHNNEKDSTRRATSSG